MSFVIADSVKSKETNYFWIFMCKDNVKAVAHVLLRYLVGLEVLIGTYLCLRVIVLTLPVLGILSSRGLATRDERVHYNSRSVRGLFRSYVPFFSDSSLLKGGSRQGGQLGVDTFPNFPLRICFG